jgi:hypothetical protein
LSLAGLEKKDVVVRKARKLPFFSIMTHCLSFEKVVMTKRRCCHQSILLDDAHWQDFSYQDGFSAREDCVITKQMTLSTVLLCECTREDWVVTKAMILSQKSQESWGKTTLGTLVWIRKYSWLMRLLLYNIFATTERSHALGEWILGLEGMEPRKKVVLFEKIVTEILVAFSGGWPRRIL